MTIGGPGFVGWATRPGLFAGAVGPDLLRSPPRATLARRFLPALFGVQFGLIGRGAAGVGGAIEGLVRALEHGQQVRSAFGPLADLTFDDVDGPGALAPLSKRPIREDKLPGNG